MKVRVLLAALVAAVGLGFTAAPLAAPTAAPTRIEHTCGSGYTHAVLSLGHKCLRAGQYCKRSADREYHKYGYHCHKRDSRGDYHLTR